MASMALGYGVPTMARGQTYSMMRSTQPPVLQWRV
jgi:hypothetical protein